MIQRIIKISQNQHLFLFGPRSTGKTTLLRERFQGPDTLWIDLLTAQNEETYFSDPDTLSRVLAERRYSTVVIDEVQKIPKLLDVVQLEIEKKQTRFVLTGSSARRLKRGAGNLLGGRALTYHLFPFTHLELKERFDLGFALSFGTLPQVLDIQSGEERSEYLRNYVYAYLKEEVVAEQLVRRVAPFRGFLPIAAQMNGQILNIHKIARDVGVDDKTIETYFEILEDTLIGFRLPPYHRSVRKRQRNGSKFYLFDPGVKRALEKTLSVALLPQTFAFGRAFEHWVILEVFRLNEYLKKDFTLSYLRTKDDAEIDLVVERPGKKTVLVEIKSASNVDENDVSGSQRFVKDWPEPCEAYLWSLDPRNKKLGSIHAAPWEAGIQKLFQE